MYLRFLRFNSTVSHHDLVKQQFRETMGRVANQAMILTSSNLNDSSHISFRGITLSSVTSLSLKPEPLIQFNLQLPSLTSDSLHQHRYFAIHVLKPDENSIELARIFSKGVVKNLITGTVIPTQPFINLTENFHYETYYVDNNNLIIPTLKNSERILICHKKKVFKIGDHEIWVGKVEHIINNEEELHVSGGLLYCNKQFHKLGNKI